MSSARGGSTRAAGRRRPRRRGRGARLRQPQGRARDAVLLRRRGEGRRARVRAARRSRRGGGAGGRARAELAVPQVVVADARAAMAPLAARFWGDPTAELRVVGVTGTNGKTTTAFLIREILEAAGDPVRAAGDGQAGRRRGRGGGGADDAGGDRPAGDLPADARGRRPGLRDGGLLARAGPAPRRRDPLRGGAVHQPDPGPPRLPRRHGGLLPRQAQAVRDGAGDARSSTSTTPTAAASPRNSSASPSPPRAPRPTSPPATSPSTPRGARFTAGRATDGEAVRTAAAGALQRRQRAGGVRGGGGDGGRAADAAAEALARRGAGAGAVRADRRGAGVRRPRRLRPHPRLAGERAAGGAAADRAAG